MSASINKYCLDSRRRDWLHCLTRLTSCQQHSRVSSTHARAHALWCAVMLDSLTHHNITYLTRDGSRLYVMTLTFDLITFNVGSESAVKWPKHVTNFGKTEKSAAEFTGSILHAGLSSDPLGELTAFSQTHWPNLNFSCLRRSLLGASTRAFAAPGQPPKTLGHNLPSRHPKI